MRTIKFLTICIFCICFFSKMSLFAQDSIPEQSYIVNLMRAEAHEIHEIEGNLIRLNFSDRYGKKPTFGLEVLDWKSEKVVEMTLDKQYGDNHYDMDLDKLGIAFEYGKVYSFQAYNDLNRKYITHFRMPEPVESEVPTVEILVDPISMDCENPSESLVELVGKIEGGRGPYTVEWEVTDEFRQKALYVPRRDKVPKSGITPVIQLDTAPNYSVLVKVTDACGMEAENRIYFVCDKEGKSPNTLFFHSVKPYPSTVIN